MSKLSSLAERLLGIRPTLKTLYNAPSLEDYIHPHTTWAFQPGVFPHARTLLDLMKEEIEACYGQPTALGVEKQLSQHFSVETGAHLCLPRAYDRADFRSGACDNVNTLVFQATLYSAAARLTLGHAFNMSFCTGRVTITNVNSCAYFQPDSDNLVRIHSNKWKNSPESYLPSLTQENFEQNVKTAFKGKTLTEQAQKKLAVMQRCIERHPDNFGRQTAMAYSELYNEVFPLEIRQVTIDYEPLAKRFLLALLADNTSLTCRMFDTEEGRDFILNSFEDVGTGWKKGETPFDAMEIEDGYPRFTRETYKGDLSPHAIGQALNENRIMPKTALLFFIFIVESGLAPIGGMFQTLYATQIRDRAVQWLKQHGPNDSRIEALARLPTDIAVVSPIWGLRREAPHQLVGYNDALEGWSMDRKTARDLLKIDGKTSLEAGMLVMGEMFFEKGVLSPEEKICLLKELHDGGRLLSL